MGIGLRGLINCAKSFHYRWGISANLYLKNQYPKQKSATPPLNNPNIT